LPGAFWTGNIIRKRTTMINGFYPHPGKVW
jgi:hypothetical protein